MIHQAGIKLDIENRDVQVNFDFDTGLIGFTERVDNEVNEFYYSESPVAFKKAFFDRFERYFAQDRHLNFKICRKNQKIMKFTEALSKNK